MQLEKDRKVLEVPLGLNLFSSRFLPLSTTLMQIFVLSTTDDGPLFANKEINRKTDVIF